MHCSNCGKQLKDTQKFCNNCGQKVSFVQPVVESIEEPAASGDNNAGQTGNYDETNGHQRRANDAIYKQEAGANQEANVNQGAYQQPVNNYQPMVNNIQPQPAYNTVDTAPAKKKSKGPVIAIVSIVAALIIGVGGFAGYKFATADKSSKDDKKQEAEKNTDKSSEDKSSEDTSNKDKSEGTGNNDNSTSSSTTVMVYMIGSNLESQGEFASNDIFEILNAKISEDVNVVIQTGGSKRWSNPKIEDGKVQRFHVEDNDLVEVENLGSLSMVENDTLSDFIKFSSREYPAERYFLVLWDHGGGDPVVGFGLDEMYEGMITYDELPGILKAGGVHFDGIITDACDMCTLEVALGVKDNCDYLVASEQSIPGMGTYYTGWLSDTNNMTVEETCTSIAKEYKKSLDQLGKIGCISVIDTSKVGDVMTAYGDFLSSIYDTDVREYMKNRENCGDNTFDIIDIISMASWYKTRESIALKEAVEAATVFYDGDVQSTNGLAVFSPYNTLEQYSIARQALSSISYDDKALDFYDSYCSLMLTASSVDVTKESWFNDKLVSVYLGDDYQATQVADSTESNSNGSGGQKYSLTVDDMGSYYFIDLDDDDWDIISSCSYDLYADLDGDGTYYYFGTEYNLGTKTSQGDIEIHCPTTWTLIDGSAVPFCAYNYISYDNGTFEEYAFMPCIVNEKMAWLEVLCDSNNTSGVVQSFFYDDDDSCTSYLLNDNDVIQFLVKEPSSGDWYRYADEHYAKDIKLSYDEIPFPNIKIIYRIKDVYGNEYESDVLGFYVN